MIGPDRMPPLQEPRLACHYRLPNGRRCDRHYRERHAHRAGYGRYKGRLVGPAGCGHGLQYAVYVDPRTYRELVGYAAG